MAQLCLLVEPRRLSDKPGAFRQSITSMFRLFCRSIIIIRDVFTRLDNGENILRALGIDDDGRHARYGG